MLIQNVNYKACRIPALSECLELRNVNHFKATDILNDKFCLHYLRHKTQLKGVVNDNQKSG